MPPRGGKYYTIALIPFSGRKNSFEFVNCGGSGIPASAIKVLYFPEEPRKGIYEAYNYR